jgi:hypothetical protein
MAIEGCSEVWEINSSQRIVQDQRENCDRGEGSEVVASANRRGPEPLLVTRESRRWPQW